MKIVTMEQSQSVERETMLSPRSVNPVPTGQRGGALPSSDNSASTAAIEALYRSVHQRLWRALLAFTGDADLASDAEAETFTQALARGSELRNPEAWVWRSAFKIASGMMADRPRPANNNPEDEPSTDAPLVELLSILETLSDQQRSIVVLRYAGGFRPHEIAELLDTSASAVSVQLNRAHTHLRKRL